MTSIRLLAALAALLPLLWLHGQAAQASVFRNPVSRVNTGQAALGVALMDNGEAIFGDYGISDVGTVEAFFGSLDTRGADGTELGAGYRHNLGERFRIDQKPVRLGVLGQIARGTFDVPSGEVTYFRLDLLAAGALAVSPQVEVFAGPLFRYVDSEAGGVSDADTDVGVLVGGELWVAPELVVGLELHIGVDDDDFALYAAFKF